MSDTPVTQVQPETTTSTAQIKKDWAAREVLSRSRNLPAQELLSQTEDSINRNLRANWSDNVLAGLDTRLSAFESALGSFQMPTNADSWFQARLVTGPDEAKNKITGTVRSDQTATPEVKILSGGFSADSETTIDPGSYSFKLSLGGYSETLSVDVKSKDTWGDVLDNVKQAVNNAPLAARADVVYQNAAFQLNPDMAGTGSVLTLSVNPDRAAQDLQVADVSGSLLSQLRLSATHNPVGAATETDYSVTGLQKALPTLFTSTPVDGNAATTLAVGRHDLSYAVGTADQSSSYVSKAFDPNAATTLAAGNYTFTSNYNGETRSHTVTIGSGWTWGDVLQTVGAELNGQGNYVKVSSPTASTPIGYSQPGVNASVDPWSIPSSTDQNASTDGKSLTVTGDAGSTLTLSDTSGGLLSTLGLTTRMTGTPVSFNVHAGDTWKDVFDNAATAINSAQLYMNAEIQTTRIPSVTTPGQALWHEGMFLSLTQQEQRIGERVSLSDGRTGALGTMGIASRERPGQDGKIIVNGREQVSENNTFSQDQGRVLLRLNDTFGESLPLSVTNGMEATQKAWGKVNDAWNSLAQYVSNNADLFDKSLGAKLEAPLSAQASNLRWLGVSSVGRTGQLWTNTDGFWKSLYDDPARARDALVNNVNGLIPSWQAAVADIRAASLDSWLKPKTAFDDYRPNLTSEFQLEQKHRLIKLLG